MKKTLGLLALVLVLLASIPLHSASASLGACHTDPTITLQPSGMVLSIANDLADSAGNISGIKYSVFVPSSVTSYTVQKDGVVPELVQVYKTNPANRYDISTYATDGANTVAVTMTDTLSDGLGHQASVQVLGTTNSSVHTDGGGWFPPAPL